MKGGQTVSRGSCREAAGWGGVPGAVSVVDSDSISSLNLQPLAVVSWLYRMQ